MLRVFVLAVATILVCVGIGLIACGVHAPGWQALVLGVIVIVGTVFERWRYRKVESLSTGQWERTSERFVDPSTGNPVDVMFDPRTGERRYVAGTVGGESKEPGQS